MPKRIAKNYPFIVALMVTSILLILPFLSRSSRAAAYFSGCGNETVDATNLAYEQDVAARVNIEREKNGLPPLKLINELTDASRHHAADMKQDDYFEHDSYDASGATLQMVCRWNKRIALFYSGGTLGENIAWGYGSPASVMDGWMTSSGHRENILNSNYREIGVGYYGRYWVQDFGRRFDVFPLIINGEALFTESPAVKLYIYGDTWTEMRLRNDDAAWGDWQPFSHDVQWTLVDEPGVHTVSVEMRNGSSSAYSSDTIELISLDVPTETPTSFPTATPIPSPTPITAEHALIGQIALQGRPSVPHASWQLPLQLTFIDPNQPNQAQSFTSASDENGRFILVDPPQGSYAVAVRGEHTLWSVVTKTIQSGLNEIAFDTLYEGDVDATNHVNLLDFSTVAAAYLTCNGENDFQSVADLNGDHCINDEDITLLRQNFDRKGDSLPGASALMAVAANAQSDLIEIAPITAQKAGMVLFVTIRINGQPSDLVNVGAFYFNFDPAKLHLTSISPDSQFPILLSSQIDNAAGHADLTAGVLGKGIQAPFTFATLAFETISDFDSTTVTLEMSGDRQTDLAGDGQSLLSVMRSEGLVFESEISSATDFVYLPLVNR